MGRECRSFSLTPIACKPVPKYGCYKAKPLSKLTSATECSPYKLEPEYGLVLEGEKPKLGRFTARLGVHGGMLVSSLSVRIKAACFQVESLVATRCSPGFVFFRIAGYAKAALNKDPPCGSSIK